MCLLVSQILLYRALDKTGFTIDFLLTTKRDKKAAQRFLIKAIHNNGSPEVINIDGSETNLSAMDEMNKRVENPIIARQVKYLNNIIEQDHRNIKRRTRLMLGFKSFWSAQTVLAGIEVVHMIKKKQLKPRGTRVQTVSEQFYSLAS